MAVEKGKFLKNKALKNIKKFHHIKSDLNFGLKV